MRRGLAIALAAAALPAGQHLAGQKPAPTGSLTFEVASIKPSMPGAQGSSLHPAPGGQRYVAANVPLRTFILAAYQIRV